MADNTTLNSGSGGDTIASDDITDLGVANGAKTQRIKVGFGADGAYSEVTSTATNPFPVALSDTDNAVLDSIDTAVNGTLTVDGSGTTQPVSGTVTANLSATDNAVLDNIDADTSAIQTAVELIDDTVYVDDADWTALSSKHGLVGGIYQSTPGTITDGDTGPIRLTSNGAVHISDGGGSVTVDGTVTETNSANILADTAAIDTNVATIAGAVAGTEMQVDVVTSALPTGAATAANQSTANSALSAIQTAVELIDNAISGTEMQVDVVAALPAGTNAIGKLAANSGVDIGDVDVTSISAGTNLIGDVGISGARTSGGTTMYRNIDVDETEDAIKTSAGQLYWIQCTNLDATPIYLQFYDASVASVTVGTTTPDLTFCVPSQGDANGAGFVLSIPNGIAFSTAITVAATTTATGSGGPAANEVILNAGYA